MDNDQRYGVSFALTQDGIGPYLQTNYYSGQNVLMGGWENKREKEPMMYDDVLRELVGGLSGYTDAFPGIVRSMRLRISFLSEMSAMPISS